MTPMERIEGELSDAQKRIVELEREVELHRAAERLQISLREKAEEREAVLAAKLEEVEDILISDENGLYLAMRAIDDAPERSLLRHDLIKQAEELEYVGGQYETRGPEVKYTGRAVAKHVTTRANAKRQQAEALNE